jgi:aspartyl-tRNA(Asn)/glutamyl-tRNA(Gln) amidotransferase subunit C
MPISNDEILHLATLARLKFPPREVKKLATELALILDYFGQLDSVDTSGVEHSSQFSTGQNVLRDDQVKPSLDRARALSGAPETDGKFFQVPRVIG